MYWRTFKAKYYYFISFCRQHCGSARATMHVTCKNRPIDNSSIQISQKRPCFVACRWSEKWQSAHSRYLSIQKKPCTSRQQSVWPYVWLWWRRNSTVLRTCVAVALSVDLNRPVVLVHVDSIASLVCHLGTQDWWPDDVYQSRHDCERIELSIVAIQPSMANQPDVLHLGRRVVHG